MKEVAGRKKTVGQLAYENSKRRPDKITAIELRKEIEKSWPALVLECYEENKDRHEGDFYIHVLLFRQPHLTDVISTKCWTTTACSEPVFGTAVYKYTKEDDTLAYLWTVPDVETCYVWIRDRLGVAPQDYCLLEEIIKFADGTRLKQAKVLNGEY